MVPRFCWDVKKYSARLRQEASTSGRFASAYLAPIDKTSGPFPFCANPVIMHVLAVKRTYPVPQRFPLTSRRSLP